MRNALCVVLLLALAVPAVAQEEPVNHFVGHGYIDTTLPIRNFENGAMSFTFVLICEKRRDVAVPCVARGHVARFIKYLGLLFGERILLIIDGYLVHRHSGLCIVVTSITLAPFSAGERNN